MLVKFYPNCEFIQIMEQLRSQVPCLKGLNHFMLAGTFQIFSMQSNPLQTNRRERGSNIIIPEK